MRLIAGKVLMDSIARRRCATIPRPATRESKALIERWHGNGLLGYAITPRFALTSSEAHSRRLAGLPPSIRTSWIHTHLAENHDEIEVIARQFPRQPQLPRRLRQV